MIEASPLSELESKFARDFEGPLPPDAPVLGIALRLLAAGAGVIEACRLMMAEGETAKELELAADALRAVHPEHDWSSSAPPELLVEQYFAKVEERDTQVLEKYQRALELHESRVSKLRDVPRFVARLTQGCDQLRSIIEHEVRFPIDDQRKVLALIENLKGSLHRGGRFPQEELLRVARDLRALSQSRREGQVSMGEELAYAPVAPAVAAAPKEILRGWADIFEALRIQPNAARNKNRTRENLKRLNKRTKGPINTTGQKPIVDRAELIAWHNGLVEKAAERDDASTDAHRQRERLRREHDAHLAESGLHIEKCVHGRGSASET